MQQSSTVESLPLCLLCLRPEWDPTNPSRVGVCSVGEGSSRWGSRGERWHRWLEKGGVSHLARQQHLAHAAICISMPLLLVVVSTHTWLPPTVLHCIFQCLSDYAHCSYNIITVSPFTSSQPEKTEAVRTKRKYEKKPKVPPLSAPQHSGPSVFNPKDLNQYDFPSSDEEPFSQVISFQVRVLWCHVVSVQLSYEYFY